jgi:Protein of unknown function (DUF3293)
LVHTEISPVLLATYQAAEYWVGEGPGAFCLRMEQYSAPLAQLLHDSGSEGAAFISAFNPFSRPSATSNNDAAHERLRQALAKQSARLIGGAGRDATGRWPEEKSFLAIGLGLEAAREIGKRFQQNAIVWSGIDAKPQLILLRKVTRHN